MKKLLIISGVLLAALSMTGCSIAAGVAGTSTKVVTLSDGSHIDCVIASNGSGTGVACIESTRSD